MLPTARAEGFDIIADSRRDLCVASSPITLSVQHAPADRSKPAGVLTRRSRLATERP
jgi:hypothetical protein